MHSVAHQSTQRRTSMNMDISNFKISLFGLCLCFALVISDPIIERSKCPGPVMYYEELGCTPVYKNTDDLCPERYNCDNLKSLPRDKCFINGHIYEIGEGLRDEDSNPCDVGCSCQQGMRGPEFVCAIVDCFYGPMNPGCYMKHNAKQCCSGPEVCPEKDEDRATCMVDGKTYRDGEYFQPAGEPEKSCYCGEGYTGENIEPFCIVRKNTCGIMLRHSDDIRENCVPTFYYTQSPQTDCSVAYRCQNDKDTVLARTTDSSSEAKSATTETVNPDMTCTFGNLTMKIGDELNQATDYSSVCMKCVCEVPPLPTCQRLSDEECDVTKHAKFDRR